MDKLVAELITLLREMLLGQERYLALTLQRREAMRTFDIDRLEKMAEQEKGAAEVLSGLDRRRQVLVAQFKGHLGRNVEATVSEIVKRTGEPMKSQLLGLAAQIKETVEKLERNKRINATISETVVKGLAKVLKVVTGLAQHAGLYMRNGQEGGAARDTPAGNNGVEKKPARAGVDVWDLAFLDT